MASALMPTPADRIARRSGDVTRPSVKAIVIRALAQLRAPDQSAAPADRIARRR